MITLYTPPAPAGHRIRREISAHARTLNMLARRAISEMSGEDWAFAAAGLFACVGALVVTL